MKQHPSAARVWRVYQSRPENDEILQPINKGSGIAVGRSDLASESKIWKAQTLLTAFHLSTLWSWLVLFHAPIFSPSHPLSRFATPNYPATKRTHTNTDNTNNHKQYGPVQASVSERLYLHRPFHGRTLADPHVRAQMQKIVCDLK